MPSPPKAPPRTKKSDIGVPFNFVHVNHVGTDFRSEDVKRALRPMADNLQINENERCSVYEKVSHTNIETPIMAPSSAVPVTKPEDVPEMTAPLYEPYSPTTSAEQAVPHYENISVSNMKQKRPVNNTPVRPSTKKYPPPPPPTGQKPKLQRDDAMEEPPVAVVLRREKEVVAMPVIPEPVNATPQIMEAPRISVVVDRPQMLDIRIHLDDKIPIQEGVSSKYRTPSMLTPSPQKNQHREMAVDVPIEYHINNSKRKAPEPPQKVPNIIKELQAQIEQTMTAPPTVATNVVSVGTKEKTRPILNDIYMQTGTSKESSENNYVACGPSGEKTTESVGEKVTQSDNSGDLSTEEVKAATIVPTDNQQDDKKRNSIEKVRKEDENIPLAMVEEVPQIEIIPAPVPRPRTRKSLSTECSQDGDSTPNAEEKQATVKLEVVRANKKKKNLSIVPELEERNDENEKENNAESKQVLVEQSIVEKEAWSVNSEPEEDVENVIRL